MPTTNAVPELTLEEIRELKSDISALQLHLKLKQGFREDQLRWPEGTSLGGQWKREGEQPVKVAAFEESNRVKCDLQRALDEELCAMQLGSWCWDSATDRWLNCMRGVYVPPLKVGKR
jgi:hypothetical protein